MKLYRLSLALTVLALLVSVPLLSQEIPQLQSVTSQQIGRFTYTTTPTALYTTYSVGRFAFTYGSDGTLLTTHRIGRYTYTTGLAPTGAVLPVMEPLWDSNRPRKSTERLYSTAKLETASTTVRSRLKRLRERR